MYIQNDKQQLILKQFLQMIISLLQITERGSLQESYETKKNFFS
jgi:hypothetical protein